MFKIRAMNSQTVVVCSEEREDRFCAQETNPYSEGHVARSEYLKTHWERVPEWEDVTGKLELSAHAKNLGPSGQTHNCPVAVIRYEGYRFVKVEAYVIPGQVAESIHKHYTELLSFRTSLLRIERKTECTTSTNINSAV